MSKISRNDPCPCGSGKKFKKCHEGNWSEPAEQTAVEDEPRRHTAAHEAGHAVAAVLLNRPFECVTLERREEPVVMNGKPGIAVITNGVMENEEQVTQRRAERDAGNLNIAELIVTMAGAAAETLSRSGGKKSVAEIKQGMATDMAKIAYIVTAGVGSRSDEAHDQQLTLEICSAGIVRAGALIEANEKAVSAVTQALLSRKTLTFAEVKAIVEQPNDIIAASAAP